MKLFKAVFILLLVAAAVFFGFRLLTRNNTKPSTPAVSTPTPVVTTEATKDYTSSTLKLSTRIPAKATVTNNLDGTVTISQLGPTQKTQTELFDGYSVTIDRGSMGANPDLQHLVEADIEQKKQQLAPDFKIIVAPITYKKTGFYYLSEDAFGEVAYYYIPQTPEDFLLITAMVKDPGKQGFSDVVGNIIDKIVSTN